MKTLDINQIKQLIPHRYPMLLVDRVLDWEADKKIVTLKNVSANEQFFVGHYPDWPVMPGVLVIEAMAQTAAILFFLTGGKSLPENSVVYFAGIDEARFKRPVMPGDQLRMEVEFLRRTRGIGKFKASASVDGQVVCEAELMCAVHTPSTAQKTEQ